MLARNLMMAVGGGPRFVSYSSATSFTTSLTIAKPAGLVSGDMLVAIMSATSVGGAISWTGDTGWTERVEQGAVPSLRVATLTAGGSEPANYTFTASSTTDVQGIILLARGAQWDTIGSVYADGGGGTVVAPSITSAGGLLLAAIAAGIDVGGPTTVSTPTGMSATTTQSFAGAIAMFYQSVLSGSTGSRTSSIDDGGSGGINSGVLISLKAA